MSLSIKWQRLVSNGKTCEMCQNTEKEVEKAVEELEQKLKPLGISVELEKESLTRKEFEEKPKESNKIYINEKPLEEWINADTGQTECCDVCGDEKCRTITINEKEYGTIPANLIVTAGIKATPTNQNTECCTNNQNTTCCK